METVRTDLQSLSGMTNLQDVAALKTQVSSLEEQYTQTQLTQGRLQSQISDLRSSHEETIVYYCSFTLCFSFFHTTSIECTDSFK